MSTKPGLYRLLLAGLTVSRLLAGCGGGGYSAPPPSSNPVPTITSLNPNSAVAGSAAFTLTVTGTNFLSASAVQWNGSARPTTFVSSTQVQAQISAADVAPVGSFNVTVFNPTPGGGTSSAATFSLSSVGITQAVSVGTNGATPNGNSHQPALNFDGRFVAFGSEATNLVSPNTMFAEAYLRDTCIGVSGCTPSTLLVSAITGTSAEGNALGGAGPSISNDGRLVVFSSTATNLIGSNINFSQDYMRVTCLGAPAGCTTATVLASVTQNGLEPTGGVSDSILASKSCNVAFISVAKDVVSGVTIPGEIYLSSCSLNNLASGFTSAILVSANDSGIPANVGAQQPAGSSDGRLVAFASTSTNLPGAPGGGLGAQNVYVRDTCTGAAVTCVPSTTMASVDSTGNPIPGNSQLPAICDDGRFIAFSTQTPAPGGGVTSAVSIRDTCNSSTGPVAGCIASTTTVSQGAGGAPANGPSNSTKHAISGDGRFVVFDSSATNLVTPATSGNQVFVRDTCMSSAGTVAGCTPKTVLISVDSKGTAIGGTGAAISGDGHFAAFENETTVFQIFLAATSF
jgi:hypothetical protein